MGSIIEFFESNQWLFYAVILIIGTVVFYVLIRLFPRKDKDGNLIRTLDDREGAIDLDNFEDEDKPEKKKPRGRFFIIESYYLPDDWEETFDVIVDRQTKVQYINYGVYGITPLIDSNGKPILYKDKHQEQKESE